MLETWFAERATWLMRHGIDPAAIERSKCTPHAPREEIRHAERDNYTERLGPALAREFQLFLSDRWNDHLDDCHGACVLRQPEIAGEVARSLRRYCAENPSRARLPAGEFLHYSKPV